MDYVETNILPDSKVAFSNFLVQESKEDIVKMLIKGLASEKKYISSRFFYDDEGSNLFEKITLLPEYYPTATEKSILRGIAPFIAKTLKNTSIIELGSGDSSKISILLDAIPQENTNSICYIPIDVSKEALVKSYENLFIKYPDINVYGMLADFMQHLGLMPSGVNRLICFFGSTLGNLNRPEAIEFLIRLRELMKPGDQLLLGLDMVKDINVLEKAYNDNIGVTAAFNKNILNVVNFYLNTNFNPDLFEHVAFYNKEEERIEMHLKALHDLEIFSLDSNLSLNIFKDETIHTENSHKFTEEYILKLADMAELNILDIYTDKNKWFSVVHFNS